MAHFWLRQQVQMWLSLNLSLFASVRVTIKFWVVTITFYSPKTFLGTM